MHHDSLVHEADPDGFADRPEDRHDGREPVAVDREAAQGVVGVLVGLELEAGIEAAEQALPAIRALLAGEPLPVAAEEFVAAPRLAPEMA